jgi:hypothetical protein
MAFAGVQFFEHSIIAAFSHRCAPAFPNDGLRDKHGIAVLFGFNRGSYTRSAAPDYEDMTIDHFI